MTDRTQNKVVLFCCPGPFQAYLANSLAARHQLVGIVYCSNQPASNRSWLRHYLTYLNPVILVRYCLSRLLLPSYEAETENRLQKVYSHFCQLRIFPGEISSISVSNINDPGVLAFIKQLSPDIICVNGTNLIRDPLLNWADESHIPIVNLHTGLSPYSRGGNCNLHMLLEGKPQYVGATIHYIDKGIDSGDICRTLRPKMSHDDPYEYIEAKVFIAGIDALVDSVDPVVKKTASKIKQWEKGKLFLLKTGYTYTPYHRLRANRLIKIGLLKTYLDNKEKQDAGIRLVS